MTDYGRAVEFGYFPEPKADDIHRVIEEVVLAEQPGLDLVGIQDHPYQSRYVDSWVLLSTLAARTSRIRLFPDVANLPLRPPAVLAKAAASVDLLSGGRFELGLGAGGFWDAIAAMGGPRRSPGEAVDALEEAIAVMRLMWSGERAVSYEGRHYRMQGVHPGPTPPHPIGVWVGGSGPRMLGLIGRVADGWLPSSPYIPPEDLAERQARIDEAAVGAGREPHAVRRIYNISGHITDSGGGPFLEGPPKQWVDELTELVIEAGMDTFILWPSGSVTEQLERFSNEVVPAVREAVATERSHKARAMAESRDILDTATTIAVVGASTDPAKAAFAIPRTLLGLGFRVIPVHPTARSIHGRRAYPRLADIPGPVDVVDVFRPVEEAPDVARQAVAIGAKAVWLQLGLRSPEARHIAETAGLRYVDDLCVATRAVGLGIRKVPEGA